jgi:hypothetical protein
MPLFCWRPWSSGRLIAVIGFLALLAMVFTSAHARAAVGDTAVGDDDASVAYTGAWTLWVPEIRAPLFGAARPVENSERGQLGSASG